MSEQIKVKDYVVQKGLLYTKDDEWVKIDGNEAVVGITDYAQKHLKDIVGIDLPEKGKEISKGDVLATVDSIKATADVYAPLSGKIVDVNETLLEAPELINSDPYNSGWIAKILIKDKNELASLMRDEEYAEYIKARK